MNRSRRATHSGGSRVSLSWATTTSSLPGHLPEHARHRAAMAARADHQRRLEGPAVGLDAHLVALRGHVRHPDAPAHVRARGRGALEQVVVELAADDPVAGGPPPAGLVPGPRELQHALVEGLDGQGVLVGVDLEVDERLRRHPARADLHAREDRRVEHEGTQAGQGQPPGRGAAARPSPDHDRVVAHHRLHSDSRIESFWSGVTFRSSTTFATSIARNRSPSRSMRLCT